MTVIDMHAHFVPREWPDLAARFGGADWPGIRHTAPGKAMLLLGEREFRPVHSALWDAGERLAAMDRDGIDIQVLCATPFLFGYQRTPEQALGAARIFNDAALELCAQAAGANAGRLKSLCQVPLQATDAACAELSRCMQAGHSGVQIGNHVGVRNLDDEGIVTFLQHCAAENAAVLVHPWDMMAADRTRQYMMGWTVGMPAETQLAIVSMILGGAFDRLPPSLRICFAHGGGSFAFLLGRLENAWHNRDIARGKSEHPPSHYCDRFSVDSAVFDQRALRLLIEVMGEDRVMLGSDTPFPLGELSVGKLVRESAMTAAGQAKVMGGNAARFFGI
ncbi:MAG: amidohydrolase [Betaproteobacteria bacterium]|nr:amidohydrolase [Betaproteobacteria bacterium]